MYSDITVMPDVFNEAYHDALFYKERFLLLFGGAGSGKSYFTAQKTLLRCLGSANAAFLLIRKVHKSIKNSQFKLLKEIVRKWDMEDYFTFKLSDLSVECINGSSIISAGVDDVEKLKSIHGITSIWIEEATELTEDEFNQIDLRMRGPSPTYKQIILTFNPIDEDHWITKRFPEILQM